MLLDAGTALLLFLMPFPPLPSSKHNYTITYRMRMVTIGRNAGRPPRQSHTSTTARSTTGPRRRYVHDGPRPSVDSSSSDASCNRHCSDPAAAGVVELSRLLLMVY